MRAGDRPGSLEGELSGEYPWKPSHRWLVVPASVDNVFSGHDDEQWLNAVNEATKHEVANWF
jgi:putative AlgH/UPF0301 family transcriptional regulator